MKFFPFQPLTRHFKPKNIFAGFTLIELLAATIMSGLVISTLLSFMLDVMRANAKETARKNTMQDMTVALDFITNELQEAVYIYTGAELEDRGIIAESEDDEDKDGIKDILDLPDSGNLEPILVFWKLEDAPYTTSDSFPSDCSQFAPNPETATDQEKAKKESCEQLKISQRTYTLVAYLQDSDPTDTWQGESVIYRYQLRKYHNDDQTNSDEDKYKFNELKQKAAYIDPQQQSSFQAWPYNNNNTLPTDYSGPTINRQTSDALVDFVDKPNNTDLTGSFACDSGYERTPASSAISNSFYACIEDKQGQITVTLHLRGNSQGRTGVNLGDSLTPLPTLESSTILRGTVVN